MKEQLARIVAELSACRADVRWVHTDSMHLTLKFLGEVDARELGAVDEALKRVAGAAQPTRGQLCDIGSFPHMSRPRVLWIGVQAEGEALAALHAAAEVEFNRIGFATEKRRFHPHLTLGRVRSRGDLGALRRAIEAHEGSKARSFAIDTVTLFESELRRTGARYTALGVHRLGGR